MTDDQKLDNLKRHLKEALGCLEDDLPLTTRFAGCAAHMLAAEALLEQLQAPPDPYANTALRPGLSRSSEHDVTNYEGKHDG